MKCIKRLLTRKILSAKRFQKKRLTCLKQNMRKNTGVKISGSLVFSFSSGLAVLLELAFYSKKALTIL